MQSGNRVETGNMSKEKQSLYKVINFEVKIGDVAKERYWSCFICWTINFEKIYVLSKLKIEHIFKLTLN